MALGPMPHPERNHSRRMGLRLRLVSESHSRANDDLKHDSIPSVGLSSLDLLLSEFKRRWEHGETPRAEDYLDDLGLNQSDRIVELIYSEFCLAESAGLNPDPADYLKRFPAQTDSLERLFGLHDAFDPSELDHWADTTALPDVGDAIGPYLLRRELGSGGFARVFLAEQADLGDRLVVVKVSQRITPEPRLLGRARHSNIVEVLSHGIVENGAFQLISMPFLGGATLAALLSVRRRHGKRMVSGSDLLADLDRVSAPECPAPGLARPARGLLAGTSYGKAVAWIVARLAEALDHAHRQGVAHGDIKPSNILLTADGIPMLLDFNLAVGWGFPTTRLDDEAGGTLAYMAPERLQAIADPGQTAPPRGSDRHRADLYALGMVLLEMLSGEPPKTPRCRDQSPREIAAEFAALRRAGRSGVLGSSRAAIPQSLGSILARCLAPDPADRYRSGAELAEDLDCWRSDRPLAFAREPRGRVGLTRWARRQRWGLTAAAISVVTFALATAAVWSARQATIGELAMGKLGRIMTGSEPGVFRYGYYRSWNHQSEDDSAEDALRHVARYDVLGPGEWRQREDFRSLPEANRDDLEMWLREQTFRVGRALRARPDSPSDWQRALVYLERSANEMPLGPLEDQYRLVRKQLNLPEPTARPRSSPAPPPWMEAYLLGVDAERRDDRKALSHYQDVLAARPNSFWAHYRSASVTYRLGDFPASISHLQYCLAQRPDNPALRGQLACCLYQLDQLTEALHECDQAIATDPDHLAAYHIRSFIHTRLGQTKDAEADIDHFELLSRGQGRLPSLKLRLDSQSIPSFSGQVFNWDGSTSDLTRRALAIDPEDDEVRLCYAAQLHSEGQTEKALRELELILEANPDQLYARYYRGSYLLKLGKRAALDDFHFLLDHPRFEAFLKQVPSTFRVFHWIAVNHLQENRVEEAIEVAKRGLELSEKLRVSQAESHFTLALVYAMAARSRAEFVEPTVEHLRQAFKGGATDFQEKFDRDPRFNELRTQINSLLTIAEPH